MPPGTGYPGAFFCAVIRRFYGVLSLPVDTPAKYRRETVPPIYCDHGAQLCCAPSLSCFEKERKDFFNHMANWQQKLSKSITGIKGVDRNIARLTIRIDSLDDFFGTKPPRIIELHRELIVAAPEPGDFSSTVSVEGLFFIAPVVFHNFSDIFFGGSYFYPGDNLSVKILRLV